MVECCINRAVLLLLYYLSLQEYSYCHILSQRWPASTFDQSSGSDLLDFCYIIIIISHCKTKVFTNPFHLSLSDVSVLLLAPANAPISASPDSVPAFPSLKISRLPMLFFRPSIVYPTYDIAFLSLFSFTVVRRSLIFVFHYPRSVPLLVIICFSPADLIVLTLLMIYWLSNGQQTKIGFEGVSVR